MSYERYDYYGCAECQQPLGCAVDCSTAPWNWDLPRTTRLAYLKRLVRWVRSLSSYRGPTGLRLSDLRWVYPEKTNHG